jgi:hypothetical protein
MFQMMRSLGETKTLEVAEQWLPGGHILAALLRPLYHTAAIVEVESLDS